MTKPRKHVKTAILCRTNAPLMECAFDLIKRNVVIKIVGLDIARALKETIGEIIGTRRRVDIVTFEELARVWIDNIHKKYGKIDNKAEYVAECDDMHMSLMALAHRAEDVQGLYDLIDTYFIDGDAFDEEEDCILLCSGHRSKGLEWDRVFILRPDLMPHPGAEREEELKQEANIEYVIKTRAKRELILCPDQRPG